MLSQKEIVEQAKKAFSSPCALGDDAAERDLLYGLTAPIPGARILDLGTGGGYLALYFAEKCQGARIVGLDIADAAIERARTECAGRGLSNAEFLTYEGTALPFPDGAFDRVVSRYALHHFPDFDCSVREITRVLSEKGRLILCDCVPTAEDGDGLFIDSWMRIIGDGHVRFRGIDEYCECLAAYGYRLSYCNMRTTGCRRRKGTEYAALAAAHPARYQSYQPSADGDSIVLTLPVARLTFTKDGTEEAP